MLLIGTRFAVIGSWDDTPCPEGRLPIYLHPGMARGHGWKSDTQRMLQKLETLDIAGKHVLDIGTGCGILAIAAARLGAKVVATEIRPASAEEAQVNFDLNNVPCQVVITGEVPSGDYDFVLCNLGDEYFVATHLAGKAVVYSDQQGEVWLSI